MPIRLTREPAAVATPRPPHTSPAATLAERPVGGGGDAANVAVDEPSGSRATRLILTLVSALALLLAVACPLLVLWLRNRGLDLTDESYYLLGLRPAQVRVEVLSDWQQMMVRLAGGRELSVAAWRVANLAVLAAGGVLLGLGLHRFLRAAGAAGALSGRRRTAIALGVVGMFAFYAYLPPTLSYNGLTGGVVYACAGLMLNVLADPWPADGRARATRLGTTVACWALVALQFWIKAPTCAALGLALGVLAFVHPPEGRRGRAFVTHLAAAAAGVAFGAALYFAFVRSPGEFVSLLRSQADAIASSTHSPVALFARYLTVDLRQLAGVVARCLPALLAAGGTAWLSAARPDMLRRATTRAAVLVGAALAAAWTLFVFRRLGMLSAASNVVSRSAGYAVLLAVVAAAWIGHRLGARRSPRAAASRPGFAGVSVVVLLVALPFVAALGTDNNIVGQMMFYPAGWLVACAVMCEQIAADRRLAPAAYGAVGLAVVAVAAEFTLGSALHPYRATEPRFAQTVHPRRAAASVGDVRLSGEASAFVDSVGALLEANGYRTGDAVVSLYDQPGLIYLLGGRSPGVAWYFSAPASQQRNCHFLTRSVSPSRTTFFLVDSVPLPPTAGCLAGVGVDLARLRPLGTVPVPNAHAGAALTVYRVP